MSRLSRCTLPAPAEPGYKEVVTRPTATAQRTTIVERTGYFFAQLWRFGMIQLQCCSFAIAVITGLAASTLLRGYWDAPILRYDALLLYLVVVQAVFLLTRLETPGELLVICAFHAAGLALEWFKVAVGSWYYPEPGVATLGGVPLYAGFMYAAVGSYICQAFRRFDLHISRYRLGVVGILAALAPALIRMHRLLPVARREHRHVLRGVGVPRAAERLAAGPPGQVRLVGAPGELELRAGDRPVPVRSPPYRPGRRIDSLHALFHRGRSAQCCLPGA